MSEQDLPVINRRNEPGLCQWYFDPSWISNSFRPRVEALVFWTLYASAFGVAFCIFVKHRNHQSFKTRSPYLTIISSLLGFLMVSIFLAEQWFKMAWRHYGDAPDYIISGVSDIWFDSNYCCIILGFFLCYALRAVRLLVIFRNQAFRLLQISKKQQHRQQQQQQQNEKNKQPEQSPSKSLLNPLHLQVSPGTTPPLTSSFLSDEEDKRQNRNKKAKIIMNKIFGKGPSEFKFFLVGFAIVFLSFLINAYIGGNNLFIDCYDADYHASVYAILAFEYFLVLIVLAIALILLRNVHDAFTINSELRFVIVFILVFGIPWLIMATTETTREETTHRNPFPASYLLVILGMGCTLFSLLIPIVNLIRPDSEDFNHLVERLVKSKVVGTNFESILEEPKAREYFMKYLESELNTENLLFYEVVGDFKQLCVTKSIENADLYKVALKIYTQFISPRLALTQVNISGDNIKSIQNELRSFKQVENRTVERLSKLFDGCLNEVKLTMQNDIFPRFQASEMFKKMCNDLHSTELDALRDAHVVEMVSS